VERDLGEAPTGNGLGPSPEDVVAAVEQSGFLMEQEVAITLEGMGFYTTTNRAFKDPDEGRSRESDVSAFWLRCTEPSTGLQLWVDLICECKRNTTPFVFLGRRKLSTSRVPIPEEHLFPKARYREDVEGTPGSYREMPPFRHFDLGSRYYTSTDPLDVVHFTRLYRKGSTWHANNEAMHDSIVLPLAKAVRDRQAPFLQARGARGKAIGLYYPIVVVRPPMYLIDASSASPEAVEVDHVTVRRELKAERLEGTFSIIFVAQPALEEFVSSNVLPFADHIQSMIEQDVQQFV
jgi:hypothetical protein